MYVYIQSEPQLWTVGTYDPAGKWQPESDHDSPADAAAHIRYLNGGEGHIGQRTETNVIYERLKAMETVDVIAYPSGERFAIRPARDPLYGLVHYTVLQGGKAVKGHTGLLLGDDALRVWCDALVAA